MNIDQNDELKKFHKYMATKLFNDTWDLLDKAKRSPEDDMLMIHTAHASLYHWLQFGEPKNFSIGKWQISRVYATLKMGESALTHGLANIQLCLKHKMTGFELGYAYESVARAYSVLQNIKEKDNYLKKAISEAENIKDADEKQFLMSDLETI